MTKLIIFLSLIALTSCASRKISKSSTTTDSTHSQTTQTSIEQAAGTKAGSTTTITDENAVTVVFDTIRITDTVTKNVVEFKDGKIVYVKGAIRTITTIGSRSEARADSLQTLAYALRDSLHTEQANVKTVIKTVDKRTGWPWWLWFIIGGITGPFLWELIKKYYKKVNI